MQPCTFGYSRFLLLLALTLPLLGGCANPSDDPSPEDATTDPGRSAFEAVALPRTGTIGDDPQALARALYGSMEPVEGNYTEEVLTLPSPSGQQVLLFTQLGLADDSLRGVRHRLEFLPQGPQWRLDWAGRQVTCWPGRGHEDWSTVSCL